MECGDIIYRSTLPRSNGITLTVPGVILALGTLSYLWATPGVAPGFFDMFVLAFVERVFRPTYKKSSAKKGAEYWLIWKFEGEATLADLLQSKEFPYNVGRSNDSWRESGFAKGLERENRIIQTVMRQLLFALDGLHSTGIVHRDIKPQNIIFSEGDGRH
ncbi:hypothetical protein DH2020_032417 [Rehmannia glutinosa]|uniref:Protein kinase domain-containing protein n=1 Tax=Rehmannia glutinosa TaxID=99300 RepID=A0ABR0VG22_REHGL